MPTAVMFMQMLMHFAVALRTEWCTALYWTLLCRSRTLHAIVSNGILLLVCHLAQIRIHDYSIDWSIFWVKIYNLAMHVCYASHRT
jgi:hypothetical protein